MTECQRCGAKANNSFLCRSCGTLARRLLDELPWWLDRLQETALGQTRMSDNGGRKSARRQDLDGEKPLAECIEMFPNSKEEDLEKARRARQDAALAHALAAGGINAKASKLHADITGALAYWVRVLTETSHSAAQTPAWTAVIGPPPARVSILWLRINLAAILAHPDAADIVGDIEIHQESLIECINRPVPTVILGPCPTWLEKRNQECSVPLSAPRDDIEVQCPRCRTVHNCHRLQLLRTDGITNGNTLVTFDQALTFNAEQPAQWQISPRTLRHWRTTGQLQPAAVNDNGQPLYSWPAIKLLHLAKPQKVTTGAAARNGS